MGNRPAAYWILVLIGLAAVIVAYTMRSSPDAHTQEIVKYLRWGGAGIIFVAILFFRRKPQPTPPMPRD